jgi:hypothetical protein
VVTNLDADKLDGLEATAFIKADGTVSLAAALNLGSTGQLVFPAVQNASAGVNTLDDYEEGTWTPTITADGGASGVTYDTGNTNGAYIKIGRVVHWWAHITLTAKGTLTGNIQIGGFPFTAGSEQTFFPGHVSYTTNLGGSITSPTLLVVGGQTKAFLYYMAAGGGTGHANFATAQMSNTTALYAAGSYLATA